MALSKYLIFGGTGSLGKTLVDRLIGHATIYVFARGEERHHQLKLKHFDVNCIVGDIRDYDAVLRAFQTVRPDVVINCAALKQVPLCEDHPYEAVLTNVVGTQNIVRASEEYSLTRKDLPPIKVLSVSTDKACKPINAYGATKMLEERIHLRYNDKYSRIHNCVRYGNVLESTGSVIPVFKNRINKNLPLLITHESMTRFLLSLNEAVDLILTALGDRDGGKIFVPKVKSSTIIDVAISLQKALGGTGHQFSGIRPGEKLHEILISEEEIYRTEDLGDIYVIHDIKTDKKFTHLTEEYSSNSRECLMTQDQTYNFLSKNGVFDI